MGKIMLNEIDYSGGNANVIRLTQAEYDALPLTKLTDNNVYMITDANGDGSQFQPVIYSEDEREIGVWTDGKPLYQKTLKVLSFSSTSPISIDVSTLDIDITANVSGEAYLISNNEVVEVFLFPAYLSSSYYASIRYSSDNIQILHKGLDDYTNGVITIQYTKTTDTAGSGTWTPQGVPAVHYSTDEQVVGTWVDGSILYEKTVEFGALPNTATKTVPHGITNVDMIFATEAFMFNPTTGNSTYLNMTNDTISSQVQYVVNRNNIEIWAGLNRTEWMGYVTVRYTKSSQGGN